MRSFDLPNLADNRKSFYGKAIQLENEEGKHLFSYGSKICTIDTKGNVHIFTKVKQWDSATSIRHLRSFLLFNGYKAGSKAEIIKTYC